MLYLDYQQERNQTMFSVNTEKDKYQELANKSHVAELCNFHEITDVYSEKYIKQAYQEGESIIVEFEVEKYGKKIISMDEYEAFLDYIEPIEKALSVEPVEVKTGGRNIIVQWLEFDFGYTKENGICYPFTLDYKSDITSWFPEGDSCEDNSHWRAISLTLNSARLPFIGFVEF